MRGLCAECQEKAGKQASIDRVATPDKLREHPDLADIEVHMEGWYG